MGAWEQPGSLLIPQNVAKSPTQCRVSIARAQDYGTAMSNESQEMRTIDKMNGKPPLWDLEE
jgi:hypothetical protein